MSGAKKIANVRAREGHTPPPPNDRPEHAMKYQEALIAWTPNTMDRNLPMEPARTVYIPHADAGSKMWRTLKGWTAMSTNGNAQQHTLLLARRSRRSPEGHTDPPQYAYRNGGGPPPLGRADAGAKSGWGHCEVSECFEEVEGLAAAVEGPPNTQGAADY